MRDLESEPDIPPFPIEALLSAEDRDAIRRSAAELVKSSGQQPVYHDVPAGTMDELQRFRGLEGEFVGSLEPSSPSSTSSVPSADPPGARSGPLVGSAASVFPLTGEDGPSSSPSEAPSSPLSPSSGPAEFRQAVERLQRKLQEDAARVRAAAAGVEGPSSEGAAAIPVAAPPAIPPATGPSESPLPPRLPLPPLVTARGDDVASSEGVPAKPEVETATAPSPPPVPSLDEVGHEMSPDRDQGEQESVLEEENNASNVALPPDLPPAWEPRPPQSPAFTGPTPPALPPVAEEAPDAGSVHLGDELPDDDAARAAVPPVGPSGEDSAPAADEERVAELPTTGSPVEDDSGTAVQPSAIDETADVREEIPVGESPRTELDDSLGAPSPAAPAEGVLPPSAVDAESEREPEVEPETTGVAPASVPMGVPAAVSEVPLPLSDGVETGGEGAPSPATQPVGESAVAAALFERKPLEPWPRRASGLDSAIESDTPAGRAAGEGHPEGEAPARGWGTVFLGGTVVGMGIVCAAALAFVIHAAQLEAGNAGGAVDWSALVGKIGRLGAASLSFLVLGSGILLLKRWARSLLLAVCAVWLGYGAGTLITSEVFFGELVRGVESRLQAAGELPKVHDLFGTTKNFVLCVMGVLAVVNVFLPGVLLLYFGRPNIRASFERGDPRRRWTDRCPAPVLAFIGFIVSFAGIAVFAALRGVSFPLFDRMLMGDEARLAYFVAAGLLAIWAIACLWCRRATWWIGLLLGAALGTALALPFFLGRAEEGMAFLLQGIPVHLGATTAGCLLAGIAVACFVYLLSLSGYFRAGDASKAP